ncbi:MULTISPECIES: transglycosylase domain-containing protein [Marinobacter]|uniref:transglycosylase domain-containing protein n=1 Tax=Marinobacter TaxID=2742 RepID=UPI001E59A425|nr:transglycosylase domain-containing protein [Marinobacter shengliensis]MCD1631561.1 transglycosylase domain-containing protein [Marinobacter shengliensis]
MAKNTILKVLIALLSVPYVISSRFLARFGPRAFRDDIQKCLAEVKHSSTRARYLRQALVIAEDHRNELHYGIDPIAIISALHERRFKGKRRGASTIEQQFVRVVTCRYEPSIKRKVREQLIAIELCRHQQKQDIADAYLSRAFFGSGQVGVEALEKSCGYSLERMRLPELMKLTSQLKYPKPMVPTEQWEEKIKKRVFHLERARRSNLKTLIGILESPQNSLANPVEKIKLQNRV